MQTLRPRKVSQLAQGQRQLMGTWPVQLHMALHLEGPSLGLMLYRHRPEILSSRPWCFHSALGSTILELVLLPRVTAADRVGRDSISPPHPHLPYSSLLQHNLFPSITLILVSDKNLLYPMPSVVPATRPVLPMLNEWMSEWINEFNPSALKAEYT